MAEAQATPSQWRLEYAACGAFKGGVGMGLWTGVMSSLRFSFGSEYKDSVFIPMPEGRKNDSL
jgi:hypothetical protein